VVAFAVIAGIGAFGLGAVERAAVTVWRHDAVGFEEEAGVSLVKKVNVSEAGGAESVAMIRALQGKKRGGFGMTGAAGINVGELEGDFHGGGTVVREEYLFEPRSLRHWKGVGGNDQFFREQRGRFIGETEGGGVGDFSELFSDGGVYFGMVMAVEVGPNGGVGIEIFAAANVAQNRAAPGSDDDGLAFEPVAHLGEGMPDVLMVEPGELMHRVMRVAQRGLRGGTRRSRHR
jgi:hypothetical protein